MAEMAQIKSSPQNWRARDLIISGLDKQKILKFDWWVVIDVAYIISKEFLNFYNLVNLFTAQIWLEIGQQLPMSIWMYILSL